MATVVAVPVGDFLPIRHGAAGCLRALGTVVCRSAGGHASSSRLALRESIPGRALTRRALALVFRGRARAAVRDPGADHDVLFDRPGPASTGANGRSASGRRLRRRFPPLLVATLLVARAFPLRPGMAGALYGLGCGLVADAGLRLYCEFTVPVALPDRARRRRVVAALGAGAAGRLGHSAAMNG